MLNELSEKQKHILTHALGLRQEKPFGRNFYLNMKQGRDAVEVDDLCNRGILLEDPSRMDDEVFGIYTVTEKGKGLAKGLLKENHV